MKQMQKEMGGRRIRAGRNDPSVLAGAAQWCAILQNSVGLSRMLPRGLQWRLPVLAGTIGLSLPAQAVRLGKRR